MASGSQKAWRIFIATRRLLGIAPENEIRRDQAGGLVRGYETEPGHRILNFARDQAEAMIEPHNVVDGLGQVAIAAIARAAGVHGRSLTVVTSS